MAELSKLAVPHAESFTFGLALAYFYANPLAKPIRITDAEPDPRYL